MLPAQIADYSVLPISISPNGSVAQLHHYIYVRPHDPKEFDSDSTRSLFVVNAPIDSTEAHFRALFSLTELGGARVERVAFASSRAAKKPNPGAILSGRNKKRKREIAESNAGAAQLPETWDRAIARSGSSAIVVFVDRPSREAAWKGIQKMAKGGRALQWAKDADVRVPLLGSDRYLLHYTLLYPGSEVLQSAVDSYMTSFSAMEAARARALSHTRALPDADGFITVTRGGRAGPARLEEANEAMEKQKEREQARMEGMEAFYRFQVREKNKERAGELVKAFEEDRRRVEDMRNARRGIFKPM